MNMKDKNGATKAAIQGTSNEDTTEEISETDRVITKCEGERKEEVKKENHTEDSRTDDVRCWEDNEEKKVHVRKRRRHITSDFICDICQKCFPKAYNLHRHRKTHEVERPEVFSCSECPKTYQKMCGLLAHHRNKHGRLLHDCSNCSKVFQTKRELLEHLRDHKANTVYKCVDCDKEFTGEGHLALHRKRKHSGKEIKCDICHKVYSKKCKLDLHMLSHTQVKAFKCDLCDKDFATKYQVKRHVKRRHTNSSIVTNGDIICKYCSTVLPSLLALESHMEYHRGEEKPYACNMCNRTFARSGNLTSHKRRDHSPNTSTSVDDTTEEETTKVGTKEDGTTEDGTTEDGATVDGTTEDGTTDNETTGVKAIEGRPFQCATCNKSFLRKSDLKRHSQSHSEERPFQCSFCGVTFKRQCHLDNHLACRHTEGKPFLCKFCGKCFKVDRYRTLHEKEMHGDLQRFFCGGCGKGFTRQVELKLHVNMMHSNDADLHVCSKCGESFQCQKLFSTHGMFVCKYCGLNFCIRSDVVKHERKHDMFRKCFPFKKE